MFEWIGARDEQGPKVVGCFLREVKLKSPPPSKSFKSLRTSGFMLFSQHVSTCYIRSNDARGASRATMRFRERDADPTPSRSARAITHLVGTTSPHGRRDPAN